MKRAALGLLLLVAALPGQERHKAAAGEHLTFEKFGAGENLDLLEIREEWILWRRAEGGYLVEGQRRQRWMRERTPREARFEIVLSLELHPVRAPRLDWLRDGASCEFGPAEFRCQAGEEAAQARIQGPYDLYANSPWLLGSAVLRAVRKPGWVTPLRLVLLDEPFGVGSFRGWAHYLGEEQGLPSFKLDAGAQQWKRVRLTPEGVVQSVEDLRTKVRTELVRYEKFAGFGPRP